MYFKQICMPNNRVIILQLQMKQKFELLSVLICSWALKSYPAIAIIGVQPLIYMRNTLVSWGLNRLLLNNLHLNDNAVMPDRGSANFDKLYKLIDDYISTARQQNQKNQIASHARPQFHRQLWKKKSTRQIVKTTPSQCLYNHLFNTLQYVSTHP